MKYLLALSILLFTITCNNPVSFKDTPDSKRDTIVKYEPTDRKQEIFKCLKDKGYNPYIDTDNDIAFSYDDKLYFVGLSKNDPNYMKIFMPAFWDSKDAEVYLAIIQVNRMTKIGQVGLDVRGRVYAQAQTLLDHNPDLGDIIPTLVSTTNFTANLFKDSVIAIHKAILNSKNHN